MNVGNRIMAICWMGIMGSVYGDSNSSPEFVVPIMEEANIMDEDELLHILSTRETRENVLISRMSCFQS